jgi:mannose-6-phosphate isomerase
LIHQGAGEETMLECFHYDTYSYEEALDASKVTPEIIEISKESKLYSIFDKKYTDCFGVKELELNGEFELKGNDSFYVTAIYAGEESIFCNGKEYDYSQGDEIFLSAAIDSVTFK